MKNLFVFVIAIVGIVTVFTMARDLPSEPPILRLYEVDESNNLVRLYSQVDSQPSEVIIDKFEHVRLECSADYPVQWIYAGNGIPILSSSISLSTAQGSSENFNQYTALAFISPLKEHHTGRYQCSHTDYLTRTPSVYIYVPGQSLFTSPQGKTIRIPRDISNVLIPCSVSHPAVQVSLEKSDGKGLRPIDESSDAISYDPQKGFRVNLRKIGDAEGTYVCIAHYNNIVRVVDYIITSSATPKSVRPPEKYEEFKQSPEETCKGELCGKRCETHTDCPSKMHCYTDHLCRDPCTYSIRCGKEALCRLIDDAPVCYCPYGFRGDATKECISI